MTTYYPPQPSIQHSPWGRVQNEITLAEGITFVDTASHGGIKLSAERVAQMPRGARKTSGWYEEDCESLWPLSKFWDELDHAALFGADEKAIQKAHDSIQAGLDHYDNDFSRVRMHT